MKDFNVSMNKLAETLCGAEGCPTQAEMERATMYHSAATIHHENIEKSASLEAEYNRQKQRQNTGAVVESITVAEKKGASFRSPLVSDQTRKAQEPTRLPEQDWETQEAATWPPKEPKKKDPLVLMPLKATKEIPQDEMTQYESALVNSLSDRYVVYYQDLSLTLEAQRVAVANIMKTNVGYSISLKIRDIDSDEAIFSKTTTCEGCNMFEVIRRLKTIGGAPTDAPSRPRLMGR